MASTTDTNRTISADEDGGRDSVQHVLGTLGDVSTEAEAQVGRAVGHVGSGVERANATLRRSSDQTLGIMGAFSVGMAVGLLLAGANRLLTIVALVPAAMVAGVALERIDGAARSERRTAA